MDLDEARAFLHENHRGVLATRGASGHHAKADAYVSLAVVASAIAVSFGLTLADPLIGLGISVLIMRITWQSWRTVRDGHAHSHSH